MFFSSTRCAGRVLRQQLYSIRAPAHKKTWYAKTLRHTESLKILFYSIRKPATHLYFHDILKRQPHKNLVSFVRLSLTLSIKTDLVVDQLVLFIVPAVQFAYFLANLLRRMFRCKLSHCTEVSLSACIRHIKQEFLCKRTILDIL